MIYTIEKRAAYGRTIYELTSAPLSGGAPATIGTYQTRKAAVTVARLLAGGRSRVNVKD